MYADAVKVLITGSRPAWRRPTQHANASPHEVSFATPGIDPPGRRQGLRSPMYPSSRASRDRYRQRALHSPETVIPSAEALTHSSHRPPFRAPSARLPTSHAVERPRRPLAESKPAGPRITSSVPPGSTRPNSSRHLRPCSLRSAGRRAPPCNRGARKCGPRPRSEPVKRAGENKLYFPGGRLALS